MNIWTSGSGLQILFLSGLLLIFNYPHVPVADMHYGMGKVTRCRDVTATEFKYCSDLNTTRFLKRIIEAEKPDFIAFTGTIIMLYNAYEL
ncbi:hypothetical protein CUMW_027710 [Citrus unshiu]|nr:hypothetical protein CUMW_027710 [Citrus unshiu]